MALTRLEILAHNNSKRKLLETIEMLRVSVDSLSMENRGDVSVLLSTEKIVDLLMRVPFRSIQSLSGVIDALDNLLYEGTPFERSKFTRSHYEYQANQNGKHNQTGETR